jgi:hypothetical protein
MIANRIVTDGRTEVTEKRRRGVLMRMRKGPFSPFGYLLMGLEWLIERVVPGRIGQIVSTAAVLLIFVCLLVVLNYAKLSRSWPNIFPPAS